jgi:hypothetical protein
MTVGWIRFLAMLLPDAKDLLRELFRWYKGDVDKARAALVHIRNHGVRLDVGEAEIDRRMQAVRDAETPPKEGA